MSEYKIRFQDMTQATEMLRALEPLLANAQNEVTEVKRALTMQIRQRERIDSRLTAIANKLHEQGKANSRLRSTGQQALQLYENAERQAMADAAAPSTDNGRTGAASTAERLSFLQRLWQWFLSLFPKKEPHGYEIDSIVFGDKGMYGGDQGGPKSEQDYFARQELYDTVRKYHPDYTNDEIRNYLKKLNSEGCGYVAMMNTIFAAYEGREKEFYDTFGFPMYESPGKLNFDRLLVDFYAATDNHVKGWFGIDKVDKWEDASQEERNSKNYDPKNDATGRGTTPDDWDYRMHLYLDKKGVDVKITNNYDFKAGNFEKISKDGYVVIAYYDGYLQNEDGSRGQHIGAHAMTVTGVTEDGRYIVSSWGKKFYIDPKETVDDYGNKTSMTFSYVQYK